MVRTSTPAVPSLAASPTCQLRAHCAQSKRLMRRLKGKSGRADVRAVNNLADPLAGSERAQRAHLEAGTGGTEKGSECAGKAGEVLWMKVPTVKA